MASEKFPGLLVSRIVPAFITTEVPSSSMEQRGHRPGISLQFIEADNKIVSFLKLKCRCNFPIYSNLPGLYLQCIISLKTEKILCHCINMSICNLFLVTYILAKSDSVQASL